MDKNKTIPKIMSLLIMDNLGKNNDEKIYLSAVPEHSGKQHLGELIIAFDNGITASDHYESLSQFLIEAGITPPSKMRLVTALYNEVIALSLHLGTPSGSFIFLDEEDKEQVIIPSKYGVNIEKLNNDQNKQRLLSYLEPDKNFKEVVSEELAKNGKEDVIKLVSDFFADHVGTMTDLFLLKQLNKHLVDFADTFKFEDFVKGIHYCNLNVISNINRCIEDIKESNDFEVLQERMLLAVFEPQQFNIKWDQDFNKVDPFQGFMAANSIALAISDAVSFDNPEDVLFNKLMITKYFDFDSYIHFALNYLLYWIEMEFPEY